MDGVEVGVGVVEVDAGGGVRLGLGVVCPEDEANARKSRVKQLENFDILLKKTDN